MAERKAFALRIDPALWAEIERWAADELRSVNGQVEFILRNAVRSRRTSVITGTDSVSAPTAARPLTDNGDET